MKQHISKSLEKKVRLKKQHFERIRFKAVFKRSILERVCQSVTNSKNWNTCCISPSTEHHINKGHCWRPVTFWWTLATEKTPVFSWKGLRSNSWCFILKCVGPAAVVRPSSPAFKHVLVYTSNMSSSMWHWKDTKLEVSAKIHFQPGVSDALLFTFSILFFVTFQHFTWAMFYVNPPVTSCLETNDVFFINTVTFGRLAAQSPAPVVGLFTKSLRA